MTPKPEPRVDVNLPVRVFGMGADNRPFFQNAHARNVSDHGAKLSGIEKQLRPGDVIGIQFGDKKARCKVVWVVDAGALKKTQIGVQLVADQECPWTAILPRPERRGRRGRHVARQRRPQRAR